MEILKKQIGIESFWIALTLLVCTLLNRFYWITTHFTAMLIEIPMLQNNANKRIQPNTIALATLHTYKQVCIFIARTSIYIYIGERCRRWHHSHKVLSGWFQHFSSNSKISLDDMEAVASENELIWNGQLKNNFDETKI